MKNIIKHISIWLVAIVLMLTTFLSSSRNAFALDNEVGNNTTLSSNEANSEKPITNTTNKEENTDKDKKEEGTSNTSVDKDKETTTSNKEEKLSETNKEDRSATNNEETTSTKVTNFETLKKAVEDAKDGEIITLEAGDYEVTEKITISGKKITLESKDTATLKRIDKYKGTMIEVASDAGLTVKSKVVFDGMNIQNNVPDKKGAFLDVEGSLVIDGATFQNDKRSNAYSMKQAPIVVRGGNITMNSGLIQNNDYSGDSSSYGAGAIYLGDGATMTMNGGTIKNNQASNYEKRGLFGSSSFLSDNQGAGAINVSEKSSLTMNGGEISNNKGWSAVVVGLNAPDMYDRNTTDESRLKPVGQAKAVFNGGVIKDNQGLYGGGIYGGLTFDINIPEGSTLEVSGNKARHGGGILVTDGLVDWNFTRSAKDTSKVGPEVWAKHYPASFTMAGGVVKNNTADLSGGGINVSSNGAKITGGEISGNKADDQGGGIYVTSVPYKLQLENAFISSNSTGAYYGNINPNGFWLYQNSGGGIWFCPTGDAEFYSENGVFIDDNNTAGREGSGLFSSKKVGDYSITLANRSIIGSKIDYLNDNQDSRKNNSFDKMGDIKDYKENLSIKSSLQEDNRDLIKAASKLLITNNTASFGGGIGTNGSIIFGNPNGKKIDVELNKAWDKDVKDDEKVAVTVELRAKTDNKDWLIEKVVLNKENNWHATVKDIQATLEGQNTKDILYVKEEVPDGYEATISKISDSTSKDEGEKTFSFELTRSNDSQQYRDYYKEHPNGSIYDATEGKLKDFRVSYQLWDYTDDSGAKSDQTMYFDSENNTWASRGVVKFDNIPLSTSKVVVVYSDDADAKEGEPSYRQEYKIFYYADAGSDTTYILVPKVLANASDADQPLKIRNLKTFINNKEQNDNQKYQFIVTNKKQITKVKVDKKWLDNNYKDRPEKIGIELKANGETKYTTFLEKKDNWTYTFENLPVKEKGKDIVYTVDESDVSGYSKTITSTGNKKDGYTFTVTNTKTTKVEVEKMWNDREDVTNNRPSEVTIHLTANGKEKETIKLNKNNSWKHSFENLPLVDENDKEIKYGVTEDKVDGYDSEVKQEGQKFVVTNKKDFLDLKVSKQWLTSKGEFDSSNKTEVEVELYKDNQATGNKVKLNEGNNFTSEFKNLDPKANYSVKEVGEENSIYKVNDKEYAVKVEGNQKDGYVVKNMPLETEEPKVPENKTKIEVEKVWDDRNNIDNSRPEKIHVKLMVGDKVISEKDITKDDNWQGEFTDLAVADENGKAIDYKVVEDEVKGYTTEIKQEGQKFVVTNKKEGETPPPPGDTPKKPKEEPKNPPKEYKSILAKTGLSETSQTAGFGILGLLTTVLLLRRKKDNK